MSVGSVTLASQNPQDAPIIDLNFLDSPLDKERLLAGVKLARDIAKTSPLSNFFAGEIMPGIEMQQDNEIMEPLRQL